MQFDVTFSFLYIVSTLMQFSQLQSKLLFSDFSLAKWKTENGIMANGLLSEQESDMLIQDLGLQTFLRKIPCNMTAMSTEGMA